MSVEDNEQPLTKLESELAAALAPDFGPARARLLRRIAAERRRERLAGLAAGFEALGWSAVGTLAATAVVLVNALARR